MRQQTVIIRVPTEEIGKRTMACFHRCVKGGRYACNRTLRCYSISARVVEAAGSPVADELLAMQAAAQAAMLAMECGEGDELRVEVKVG